MRPTDLARMSPAERAALIRDRRQEAQARLRQDDEVTASQDGTSSPMSLSEQATLVVDTYTDDQGRLLIPVRLGNLMGPEGNVFNVIGAVRAALKWANGMGLPVHDEQADIVNEFRDRTYDETLNLIETWMTDLDGSIAKFRSDASRPPDDPLIPPKFGDNPVGGWFQQ